MRLLELRLKNWGPFEDQHSIALSVTPEAPVILFRGENMRGKTSLLRAIVWCMYGALKQQDGRSILDVSRMVNRRALESATADFEVAIRAEHKGEEFELTRFGKASLDSFGEVQVEGLRSSMLVTGKNPLPEQSIPDFIEGILSEQISDFYFFDGEMLARFEERLREDKESTRRFVRDQVERALGLPFIASLHDDLEEIEAGLAAQIKKAAQGNKKARDIESELESVDSTLDIKSRDVADLLKHEERLRESISQLEQQLESAADVRDSYFKRQALEKEIATLEGDIRTFSEALSAYVDTFWWFPLGSTLKARADEAAGQMQDAKLRDRERVRLEVKVEGLLEQISQPNCTACGQPLPHDHLAPLEDEISAARARLSELDSETNLDEIQLAITRLTNYSGGAALEERVVDQEKEIRALRMRLDKRLGEVRVLSELLAGNTLEIGAIEAQRRSEKDNIAEVAMFIKQGESDIRILKSRRTELRSDLSKLPEMDPLLRQRMKVYTEAVEIVGKSFETFRSAMRTQIQAQASEIFRRLTTEKDYTGVLLREDYSLAVLDEDGKPLNMVSAGANQILTMSFIGALSQSSAEEAPMIMDTPLGRLDQGHRAAILDWVSSMRNQVILFVQSGEYNAETDTKLLGGKIGREYIIERVSANSSKVVAA